MWHARIWLLVFSFISVSTAYAVGDYSPAVTIGPGYYFRVLFILFIFLVLLIGGGKLLITLVRGRRPATRYFTILDQLIIQPGSQVLLIKGMGKVWMIGATGQSINVLSEFSEESVPQYPVESFQSILSDLIHRHPKEPESN